MPPLGGPGLQTLREPLLLVLHAGYDWLAVSLLRLVSTVFALLSATAAASR